MPSATSNPDNDKWTVHALFNEASRNLAAGQQHFTAGDHDKTVEKVAEATRALRRLHLMLSSPHTNEEEFDIETLAREMFPTEYEAITDDRPMDPEKVQAVKAELARRRKNR